MENALLGVNLNSVVYSVSCKFIYDHLGVQSTCSHGDRTLLSELLLQKLALLQKWVYLLSLSMQNRVHQSTSHNRKSSKRYVEGQQASASQAVRKYKPCSAATMRETVRDANVPQTAVCVSCLGFKGRKINDHGGETIRKIPAVSSRAQPVVSQAPEVGVLIAEGTCHILVTCPVTYTCQVSAASTKPDIQWHSTPQDCCSERSSADKIGSRTSHLILPALK